MLLSNSLPTAFSWFHLATQKCQGLGAQQTYIPLHNLADQLKTVKNNGIILNQSLHVLPFNSTTLLGMCSHSKRLSHVILVLSLLELNCDLHLWYPIIWCYGRSLRWQQSIVVFSLVLVYRAFPNSLQTDWNITQATEFYPDSHQKAEFGYEIVSVVPF